MRVVYVAGPFKAATHWDVVQNVRLAEFAALEVWRAGAAALCPHLNSANFIGAAPERAFLDGYLELVRRSDAVYLVDGWEKSSGSRAEVEMAEACDIPVFGTIEELREWVER